METLKDKTLTSEVLNILTEHDADLCFDRDLGEISIIIDFGPGGAHYTWDKIKKALKQSEK